MASGLEFAKFVSDQLSGAGCITYRKMFGEYGVYCDGKIFALICDNQLYIKITESGRRICPGLPEMPPYNGARNYFLVADIEDRERLVKLVQATCQELPAVKPKKGKDKNGQV